MGMKAEAREARVVVCGDAGGARYGNDVAWGRLKINACSHENT